MRVARDKSKAGSHPPPARRASIHVALNVNRTDRGRAAKSKSFRATVSHGQIEDSKSKGHPSFHLFQSGHWPIATADSLSFPFFLSLSLSRAVKRPRCAPRPLHYRRGTFSPPRRRCRCFLLRFQSFIPSPVVCPSAHFNINYRVVDGYVYVQESDTVRRRWREEAADLVSERRRGQAFGGRSIGRRETLRAAAAPLPLPPCSALDC